MGRLTMLTINLGFLSVLSSHIGSYIPNSIHQKNFQTLESVSRTTDWELSSTAGFLACALPGWISIRIRAQSGSSPPLGSSHVQTYSRPHGFDANAFAL